MGILDAVGPIIAIVVIYVVYQAFMNMETAQKEKETSIEISKIEAETEREKVRLEREKMFLEYNKLSSVQQLPLKDAGAEYKVLQDKRDKEVG